MTTGKGELSFLPNEVEESSNAELFVFCGVDNGDEEKTGPNGENVGRAMTGEGGADKECFVGRPVPFGQRVRPSPSPIAPKTSSMSSFQV